MRRKDGARAGIQVMQHLLNQCKDFLFSSGQDEKLQEGFE